jgi:hypothetical protein
LNVIDGWRQNHIVEQKGAYFTEQMYFWTSGNTDGRNRHRCHHIAPYGKLGAHKQTDITLAFQYFKNI